MGPGRDGQRLKRLDPKRHDLHVFACHGNRCTREGAPTIRRLLLQALKRGGVRVRISRTGCQGHCKQAPVVFVEGDRARVWGEVGAPDVARLADKLIKRLRRARR